MADFAFTIVADASKADEAVDKIERRLVDVSERATSAGRSLNSAFDKGASAAERAAAQLQHEEELLRKIHGPAQQYAKDLEAIQSLHQKGMITAAQYAEQLKKIQSSSGAPAAPAAKPGFIESMGGTNPLAGIASTPVGIAGAVGAGIGIAGGIADKVEEWRQQISDLEDRVTTLTNKAQKFTGVGRDVNNVLDQQAVLGAKLNTSSAGIIDTYDAIGDATERLNLTATEQARITETVGKAAQLGGKSMEAAGDIMNRLSVAFETGANTGGTLRKLFTEFPDLAAQLSAGLGLTKTQIIQMADAGRIGFADIAQGLMTDTEVTDNAYKKIQRTHAQTMQIYTQEFERAKASGDNTFLAMLKGADAANGKFGETITVTQVFDETIQKLQRVSDRAFLSMINGLEGVGGAMKDVANEFAGVVTAISQSGFYALVKAADPWFVAPETPKKIRETTKALKDLSDVDEYMRAAREKVQDDAVKAYRKSLEQQQKDRDAAKESQTEAEADVQRRSTELLLANGELIKKHDEDLAKQAEEAARRTREAWASGLGGIAADIANLAIKGEFSFSRLADSLAKLALQIAAMQIGGAGGSFLSALAGGLGGGANGFDYTVGGGRLQLPGFATGGNFMVGGYGGVDTSLVAFRATPGESVHVRTPEQRAEAERAMSAPVQLGGTTVIVRSDPREITAAMGSRSGQRELVNLNRKFSKRD